MAFKFMQPRLGKLCLLIFLLFTSISFSIAQNPIVNENLLLGTDQAVWDPVADNAPIEGFAQELSVNKGQTVHFKIDIESASLQSYTVKIYRLGWYNGKGARFITNVGSGLSGSQQAPGNYDPATGKIDCNNWPVATQWDVPSTAVSGVYVARLDCPSLSASSLIIFVVRDDNANSPVLFKTSDATWQAYNEYGGNSFYNAAIPVPGYTHATKLSYQRPIHMRGDKSNFFNAEYPMLRWMEKNGYDVTYTTDMDMARDASAFTPSIHKTLLSVGHDEYWSKEQFDKFETARNNGVNLAFFSGNEVYWKTRWEDSYQTLVCYKEGTQGESICNAKCDPLPNVWTGLWRDGCSPAYAANDGCRPEGGLTGQMSWTQSTGSIKVPDTYKNFRFWKNTSVALLGAGQEVTLPYGTLGNEWDPEQFTSTYPAHRIILSNTTQNSKVHKMSLYRHSSGAFVFGAGTMQWAWGLDDKHDLNTATPPVQPVSMDMKQATMNLFSDMGLTPGSPESGLIVPAPLADVQAPNSTISYPIHGSSVPGSPITITGTSVDNGGSTIAGVEVSIDNGVTWQNATGLNNWTYTFSPAGYGNITIKVRAWDDVGNVEAAGTAPSANAISISLAGPFNYSVFNSSYPQNAPLFFTGAPVELGMKFKSTVPGFITGFRYYKGPGITGEHIGHLWDAAGNLLASGTFTNETASGWQSVTLATPVAITQNTTYVVSYFTSSGEFTRQDPFFTTAIVNGFLRGLANGEDGGNGVYAYASAPVFPNNNFNSVNYFADVIFETNDQTAPTVLSVTPANNATGILLNVHPSATFSEELSPASVTRSSVIMTGPGGVFVSGTVSLSGGNVVTFTPNADLAINSTYTVTLKGGITEPVLKDLIGNALASNYLWSFTTGNLLAPSVSTKPLSQSVCANSSVSFTSAGTGIPTPTVQWQVSTNNGANWMNIPGAVSATYTFTAIATDNNNLYRAVWSNSQGVENSVSATLTVSPAITGTIQAVNANVCPGAPMQLQLSAASGPSPYSLIINSNTYNGIQVGQPFRPVLNSENIWLPSNVPGELVHVDNNSIEVGVKFQSNKDGVIKGIRFYKGGAANAGTHVGSLWSRSGTLLGQATFTNETGSGWQEVLFAAPVPVTSGTTYIASYFLPQGNYSKNGGYFTAGGHSNGNSLTALQNTVAEPNGVYTYAGSSTFPDQDFGETNYWVDVVFAAYAQTSTTFNLTTITASNGCSATGNPISTATITLGAPVTIGAVTGLSPLCIGNNTTYTNDGSAGGTWSSSNESAATVNAGTGVVTAVGPGNADIIYTITGCNGTFTAQQNLVVGQNANAGTVSGNSPICIGATGNFTSNGDPGGNWSSSDPSVASVDATGFVTALTAGTADIIYTISTGCNSPVAAHKTVTVNPNANAGAVNGTSPLCIGATATYTSNGDAGGNWSSSSSAVASVNSNGVVTGLSAGTTDIRYTVTTGCNGPVSSFITLTVNPNATAGTVSGNSPLCIGATTTYTSDGNAGGIWSSSSPAVASVNSNGLVTALSAGSTNITYTVNSGCNAPVSVFKTLMVSPNATAGTVFSGSSTACTGTIITYTSNGDQGGVWSSSNPAVASATPSGQVTTLSGGTTNIIYTVNSGCNAPASSFAPLTVTQDANPGTVSGASPLCINATATYTKSGSAGGTWSSSNPAVASVNASGQVTALSAGTTNIIYTVTGCTGQVSSFAVLTVSPNANAGTVSGTSPLCTGATATYSSNGNGGGVWSSSNPAVASVNASGIVTALTAGTTNITYQVNNGCNSPVSSFAILTVNAAANPGTVSGTSPLCINAMATYIKSGSAGGVWGSSNPAVASVNANGQVTALSAGTTNITYTVTGCTGQVSSFAVLTVNPNANAGTVSGTSPLCTGATATYSSNGNGGGVWSSSNPAVASVNAAGIVTALSAGTTNIRYTVNTGCNSPVSSFAILTVNAAANPGTVSGTSPLCVNATATYTSSGSTGGIWSSSNTAVATVSTNGSVTALTAGTSNITYTVTGCTGQVSAFKLLTVSPDANAGTVSGTSPLCVNATATYSSNGNTGGTWSSTNTSVATVSATGLVTTLAAGTTNITYKISSGCNSPVSSFKTLTVGQTVNAGTVTGTSPLCVNATATYSSNGNTGGSWSSSNMAVATVNAAGLVTALSAGTTNITYTVNSTCGGQGSSFKTLTVSPNANAGTVNGNSPLCIGATATYSSNGNTGGAWSSSNPAVATVNAIGLVTAIAAGTTNITYRINSGCNSPVSSFAVLTVNPNVNAGTVSGNSPLCTGATATYSSNGNTGGTWSSSNPAVASVNAAGLVTAIAAGTTNITYRINSGCNSPVSSFKTLTVGQSTNAGTISGTSPLCIGSTVTYSSNGNSGGTWSSSNPAVATVNAAGLVKALSTGVTNITYTVSSGCGGQVSSVKTLIVSPNANAGTVSGSTPSCSLQTSLFTSDGDAGGTWSSSNPWVAYVWPTGHVTALFFGTANVIYTVNSGCNAPVSAYKTISISLFAYAGIVSGNSPVCAGTTTNYTSNGSSGGVWSSSNTSVATVNASGVVTAISGGSAVITYTVRACIGTATASKTITVTPGTVVNAGTISGTSPLCINATDNYTSNGNTGGTWSSSSPSIASVNATTGVVKALSAGTTNIIYTKTPSCGVPATAVKNLKVNNCYNFANTGSSNPVQNKTLQIEAYPNPAHAEFTLVLKDYSTDKVSILVTDVLGNKVYQAEGTCQKEYHFGKTFMTGIYLVQVVQGNNKQSMKLIKE